MFDQGSQIQRPIHSTFCHSRNLDDFSPGAREASRAPERGIVVKANEMNETPP